jgi:CRP/FNR family transcriptional regulator, cyclic AMP receptor protein
MLNSDADASALLASLSFLQGADPAALTEAARLARCISLRPGEAAIGLGDTTNDVFLVADGAVRIVVHTRLGQEVIFGDLGPGELFGEMAAIDGAPRSASVTALSPTRLWRLPATAFLDLALRSPPVGRRLLRKLVDRLRIQDERTLELATLPVRLRLAAELLRLSRPRGAKETAGGGISERVVSPPPQQHILAARIGARREAISRELTALVREGLIQVSSRAIVLPRPDVLRAIVEEQLLGKA